MLDYVSPAVLNEKDIAASYMVIVEASKLTHGDNGMNMITVFYGNEFIIMATIMATICCDEERQCFRGQWTPKFATVFWIWRWMSSY